MDFIIEKMPAHRIAYIRHTGPYGISNGQTMEALKKWAKENQLLRDETIIFGIARDNPETTKLENCRYDACIVVADDFMAMDVTIGSISGGKYAVFKIDHTAEAVQKAWMTIFSELSAQGEQFDEQRPIIERYNVQMVNNHYCEICVPLH